MGAKTGQSWAGFWNPGACRDADEKLLHGTRQGFVGGKKMQLFDNCITFETSGKVKRIIIYKYFKTSKFLL